MGINRYPSDTLNSNSQLSSRIIRLPANTATGAATAQISLTPGTYSVSVLEGAGGQIVLNGTTVTTSTPTVVDITTNVTTANISGTASFASGGTLSGGGNYYDAAYFQLAFDGTNFWFAPNISNTVYKSTNGVSWTSVTPGNGGGNYNTGIAYGNGVLVTIGGNTSNSTMIRRSTNGGTTWSTASFSYGGPLTSPKKVATDGAGNWVICISNYVLYSSDNGASWSDTTNGLTSTNAFGLTYGSSGGFVMGNGVGRISYSATGSSWTNLSTAASAVGGSNIVDIAYGGGTYVAVASGVMASSTNATTWTARTNPYGSKTLSAVGYGNGYFLLHANESGTAPLVGNTAYSTNGITWTVGASLASSNSYGGVAVNYANGIYMIMRNGSSGTVETVTSPGITGANTNNVTVMVQSLPVVTAV